MRKTVLKVGIAFGVLLMICILIVAGVLRMRTIRHQRAREVAIPVVYKLGGRVDALIPPFGVGEYHVTFDGCTLTRDDVDRLVVLNELIATGGHLGLSVEGTTISDADREHLRQILPQVHMGSATDN